MTINYITENGKRVFDRTAIRNILNVSKSKLHRELSKLSDVEVYNHRNQHLYDEKTMFHLMELVLIERIRKESRVYGLQED